MTSTPLTPTQHAVLAYALEHTSGKIEWFPERINGGVRKKVLDSLFNRALITPSGTDWFVAAEGYDAMGRPRPTPAPESVPEATPETAEDIAPEPTVEPAPLDPDPEIEDAVTAAEAEWSKAKAKPRTRENSKQAEILRMLQRAEGATIAQICQTTGWQAHTVRGTFAGAFKKKLGLAIVSDKAQGGERVYRIA